MKKRLLTILLLIVFIFTAFSLPAAAEEGTGKAYTYDHNQNAVAVPDPYSVTTVLYGENTGFNKPADLVHKDGYIYVLNSESEATVTVLNKDYTFNRYIYLTKNGEPYQLGIPESIWIDVDGTILFADSGKKLVVRATMEGEVIGEYGGPNNEASLTSEFTPYKVLTDYLGRLYVLSQGEYRGILRFTADGEFVSYFGSKQVQATAAVLLDMMWRNFMSDEQIANSVRYLPTEYSNMTIDELGFLFVTSGSSSAKNEYIVKLNSNGSNVLEGEKYGDFNLGSYNLKGYSTSFNAVTVDEDGFITVADKTWNRLMQYSSEGELLYIFAGQGSAVGTFSDNSQIISIDKEIVVADSVTNAITVMQPTRFGLDVRNGYLLYQKGLFEESIQPWQNVLDAAGNYEAAYIGIGKALQLKKDYKGAMDYFKMGYSRADYSAAYQRYRSQVMRDVFPIAMTVIMVLAVLAVIAFKVYRKKHPKTEKPPLDKRGKLAYLFYTQIHPFDGFAEMRYNHKGSVTISTVLVFLWFLLEAVKFNYKGFIFNQNEPQDFSIIALLATTVGLSAMLCLSNWLLSTFFEGKGTLKNVWIHFGYGLVPMLVAGVIEVILSNLLTQDENFFIYYIGIFGAIYSVFLILIGNGELHQYSFKRNIFSMLASLVGVLIMLFVIFLFFNLIMQISEFATSVIEEAFYRFNVGF
ncbi:MAG: YIP1 family protein [Clostridia bacterium]|nr:YIP1 family protein [Clostridia bacterium]